MGHHESGSGSPYAEFERSLHPLLRKWLDAKNEDIREKTMKRIAQLLLENLPPDETSERTQFEKIFLSHLDRVADQQRTFYERFCHCLIHVLRSQDHEKTVEE